MFIDRNYPSRSIYALIDPRDNMIRYVGCAIDVEGRFKEHLRDKGNTPKCRWLAELKRCGLRPKVEILEVVDNFFGAFRREDYWIDKLLSEGIPLTNSVVLKGVFAKPDKTVFVPFNWKGTKLRYMRKKLGITREELASRTDLTMSAYNRAEQGQPVSYGVARDILCAINSCLQESGQAEMTLIDIGWETE